ncbi:uncharacterized protein LOC104685169 isoform X2 [Corvus cornix cornix]|uniref:uncharacterized protein LOC104685169 isoform X2 n=1 Tax=Corvus cornix cornix TaxID=932674 RepID=UPI00194E1C2F|nr:uncharacterized protein LOC104685169 isoform X2 [Corvus cornix cornix]
MAPQGRNWLNFAPLVPQICLWPLTRDEAEQGKAGSSFQLGQVVPGTESMKNPEVVQGQAASPCATANLQHPFLPTRRAVWPQQQHRTPVLAPARASSLGIEEAKTPQEAMGEPLRAVVMKIFGGPDETCEEKIQSHLQSLRKVLAEFLDWRVKKREETPGLSGTGGPLGSSSLRLSSSGCASCWRSRSTQCWGGWLSWVTASQLPMPKNHCRWPRGLHNSTDSLGCWRPGACPQ